MTTVQFTFADEATATEFVKRHAERLAERVFQGGNRVFADVRQQDLPDLIGHAAGSWFIWQPKEAA